MRTAILFGCIYVGNSITKGVSYYSDETASFFVAVIIVCGIMDIIDFFNNTTKK